MVLMIIGGVVAALLFFGMGMLVGYRRGVFAARFGQDYYHNFVGSHARGPLGVMVLGGQPLMNGHGMTGIVIAAQSSTIVAQNADGNEESIVVASGTIIRKFDQTVPVATIVPGERIIVIGEPNADGQIDARFIRIFPRASAQVLSAPSASSSTSSTTGAAGTSVPPARIPSSQGVVPIPGGPVTTSS